MLERLWFYQAQDTQPYANIALEEELLETVAPGECILYLWQNQNTVVIGRNQNCRRECRVELMEAEGVHLARRLSGGGAVFHDLGNLNFTFLVHKEDYSLTRQTEVILQAVQQLGISAQRTGRNDIAADGRKFSGNAFYSSGGRSYHHGTLLVDADMGRLSRYLTVAPQKLQGHGVQSVQGRVVNLAQLVPGLTVAQVRNAVLQAVVAVYGLPAVPLEGTRLDAERLKTRRERFASWQWRLGQEPAFGCWTESRYPWGGAQLGLAVRGGVIADVTLYTDALRETLPATVAALLCGLRFERGVVQDALLAAAEHTPECKELAELSKEFFR